MKHILYIVIFFLICCPLPCKSQDLVTTIKFADSLMSNGELKHAINEYQRAYFFCDEGRKYHLGKRMADCYFALKDFIRARSYYDSAFFHTDYKNLKTDCEFQKILCYMMEENFDFAQLKLNDLEVGNSIHLVRKKNLYKGICHFGTEQYDESQQYFLNSIPETDSVKRKRFEDLYESRNMLKRPNTKIAVMMSILVPGSGQMYSGDFKDGVNSLLLLGGLVYLGTSGIMASPIVIVPFFFKYYMGGILNAKQAADSKRKAKQSKYYINLMDVLL